MSGRRDPGDTGVVIAVLRAIRGWDQSELAAAAGLSPSSISRYEKGETIPTPKTFRRIVAAVGVPSPMVDRLFAWVRSARAAVVRCSGDAGNFMDLLCGELTVGLADAIEKAAGVMLASPLDFPRGPWRRLVPPSELDRQQAPSLLAMLLRRQPSERRVLIEDAQEFRSWGLCELLCAESIKAASDDTGRAVELAELAVFLAERVPGEETWRWRVQGYAGVHLGNARRVRTDWPGAEEAFARAAPLWEAGAPGDPGLLAEALVPGLEASLRIDQDRLPEASVLLDRALEADKGAFKAHLLLNKARLLEWAGDYEGALATLRQVGPLPDRQQPRLLWLLRICPAFNLCHLGRFGEAEALLPEIRELTMQLGNGLDSLRLRWLEARIAAGLGRAEEALVALSQVRSGFAERGIAYDAALATLELAVLYLEQGRTQEVKILAGEMAPIFKAQGVHREALAALRLFCQAAEQEAATVEMVRRVVEYLYRAQHDPGLRFEG